MNFSILDSSTSSSDEYLRVELYTNGFLTPFRAFDMTRQKAFLLFQYLVQNPFTSIHQLSY
jgi:hypothetical protein